MRTDAISYVLSSENRKKIVRAIFGFPRRQWSCSGLEELTKISHATVFRTLKALRDFGVLKSIRINKKDIIYELVEDYPLTKELMRLINIEKITVKNIAKNFIDEIKSKKIYSVILYGSGITGKMRADSDIDILVVLGKTDRLLERKILDRAGELSSRLNRTISVVVMDLEEIKKEKNTPFIISIRENMEVLYGKKPF